MRKTPPTSPEPGTQRGPLRRALLGTTALLCSAWSAFALEPSQWKHRQTLTVERAGITKVALPPATLDLARASLEDVRVLDAAGREVPYVLERAAPSVPPTVRAPRAFRVTLSDASTQLLIETGSDTPLAALSLSTPAPNFLKAAQVEVSADGENWTTLQTGAPVFRQFGAEQLRLEVNRPAAQVRITIDDTRARPVPFTGAILEFVTTVQPPVTSPLPVQIARREEFAGETLLTLDLGAKHVPLAALEFVTGEPLFVRNVTVSVRELQDDTAVERTLGSGTIFRVAADGLAPRAKLDLPLDFVAPSRELLVHIANHDSPPLAIDELRAQQRPIWLVFRAAEPGAFTLLTGNPDAAAPRYDLASLARSLRDVTPSALTVGAPELNAGYRRADGLSDTPILGATLDPAPWGFRKAVQLAAAGVQQLELDLDVLSRAQPSFADLRLLRAGTQVPYLLERPAVSRSLTLEATSRNDPKRPQLSRWELTLPRAGLPITQLTLTSPTPLFQRHVRVLERVGDSRGGHHDRTLASASWSKTPGNGPHPSLVLPLSFAPATDTLLIETDNGDNPPIALGAVHARYPVARLLFRTTPGPLSLYYGNDRAHAPRYDLSLVAGQILSAEKHIATLDAEEKARADGWASTALAGVRGGPLFWGALALVVVVLLVLVAKLLPKPPAA